jgi:enoyl-CoA hydratase/carnithine racemase
VSAAQGAVGVGVDEPPLLYEMRGGAAWITLNRPRAMNAFNSVLNRALIKALRDAADDDGVLVAVLIGAGGKAFSAGADLKELAARNAAGMDIDATVEEGGMAGTEMFRAVAAFRKPLIAAIDGFCLAGGMEVAALCDMRLATEASSFGLPEAHLGLMPDPGLVELTRLIPLGEALKLQLSARPMTARRAYDIGYIQGLVPNRAALLAEAELWAADVARGAPLSVEAFKKLVKVGRSMTPEQASQLRDALWQTIQNTEDCVEGPRAFAEKRAPVWKRR